MLVQCKIYQPPPPPQKKIKKEVNNLTYNSIIMVSCNVNLLLEETSTGPLWSLHVEDAGDGGGGMSGFESLEESRSGLLSGLYNNKQQLSSYLEWQCG